MMKMNISRCGFVRWGFVAWAAATLMAGCGGNPNSGKGLRMPDGDIQRGKTAFVDLGCIGCHTVDGVPLPASSTPGPVQLRLGGTVVKVKTYGQLLTSVINPVHVLSPAYQAKLDGKTATIMPNFNDKMTVQQMIDIVTFLQARYELLKPAYNDYSYPYQVVP